MTIMSTNQYLHDDLTMVLNVIRQMQEEVEHEIAPQNKSMDAPAEDDNVCIVTMYKDDSSVVQPGGEKGKMLESAVHFSHISQEPHLIPWCTQTCRTHVKKSESEASQST
jgi:hypothetical protein